MLKFLNLFVTIGFVTVLASCSQQIAPSSNKGTEEHTDKNIKPKVIYGSDDRLDLFQVNDEALLSLADSTVALMRSDNLEDQGNGTTNISGRQFGSSYGLCESEPFYHQNTAAFCSGSLVGPDLVMTAGHCISAPDCGRVKFVFGFGIHTQGLLPNSVPSDEVYSCSEVIASEVRSTGADFAIVRLDRVVAHHNPLPVRRSGQLQVRDDLLVIGHPAGLPTKVAGGANVREIKDEYIVANLDTYGGNSGSAVFNARSGHIEGILVRGEVDFVFKNGCRVSNVCESDSCQGEDVTRVSQVLQYIPKLTDDGGGDSDPPSPPEEYSISSDKILNIPDNSSYGVTSTLSTLVASKDQEVQVSVNIKHTWRGDLKVELYSPSGDRYILHNRQGRSQDNLVETYTLKQRNHEAGAWKLKVSDHASWDQGQLLSWKIKFK